MSFAQLRQGLGKHESNDQVRESLNRLMRVQVIVHYRSPVDSELRTLKTHLLEFIDTSNGDSSKATVQYGIPRPLWFLLIRSNRWGRVRSEITYAMTSKYAIALYEHLCLRSNLERAYVQVPFERFRAMLGVAPGTYKRSDHFKEKVLGPAVIEVYGLSDIGVDIQLERHHPKIPPHAVSITWWKKQGEEFRAAIRERARPKVGRMARLRGTVEQAVPLTE